MSFNPLKFVQRLKAAGISVEHSEAEAGELSEALAEVIPIDQIATQVDIAALRNEIERATSDIIKMGDGTVDC